MEFMEFAAKAFNSAKRCATLEQFLPKFGNDLREYSYSPKIVKPAKWHLDSSKKKPDKKKKNESKV